MHKTAKALMSTILDNIGPLAPSGARWQVLDVGSRWINGSYREMVEALGWSYTGLDVVDGGNVDILASSPYNYPIDDASWLHDGACTGFGRMGARIGASFAARGMVGYPHGQRMGGAPPSGGLLAHSARWDAVAFRACLSPTRLSHRF